ncbi:MAG: prolipoprotein diacylglyceryl transferase family protein, partial [Sedimentisphaerales bacterium]
SNTLKLFAKPGSTSVLMLILYGLVRFFEEFLRDDSPFETAWWMIHKGWTISQNLSIYMVILGAVLIVIFQSLFTGGKVSGKS